MLFLLFMVTEFGNFNVVLKTLLFKTTVSLKTVKTQSSFAAPIPAQGFENLEPLALFGAFGRGFKALGQMADDLRL